MHQSLLRVVATAVLTTLPLPLMAEGERDFDYDEQVVKKLSLDELKTIATDAGITKLETFPLPDGASVISGYSGEYRIFAFLQNQSSVLTIEFVSAEHNATLDRINAFHQNGIIHGVTGQLDRDGRAKLSKRLDFRYGMTKKTLRKQLAFFAAVEVKLFHGSVCK